MTDPEHDRPGRTLEPGCFEDRLQRELRAYAEERAAEGITAPAAHRRRRGTVLARTAAAAVVASAAVVVPTVLLGNHGARSAYAVQRVDDGKVSLEVSGAIAQPKDMEHALKSAGAPVKVVPARSRGCRHARPVAAPAGLLTRRGPRTFVIDPHKIPHGTTLVAQVPIHGHAGPLRLLLSSDPTPRC